MPAVLRAFLAFAAAAQTVPSVASLVGDGYAVVAVWPTGGGPGMLLQKGADLRMVVVIQTPERADIATLCCKPAD